MQGKTWILMIAASLGSLGMLNAQPPDTESEYEKAHTRNINQEFLYGVYIPKDLTDAFVQLNKLIDKESKAKFKNMPEDDAVNKLHFSFGRWMIINWAFYEGSRITVALNEMGVYHPDDMAQFLIRSYHRSLNERPIDVKGQLAALEEKKLREKEERLQNGTVIFEEKRQLQADSSIRKQ
ncbi:MAG TPA: hypothetical protein PKA00_13980 [Saprospiraceae bacterium]|nr:hypothetical protein [Saprospiraceae bacterium]HMQ84020.1 hypothetical protein [Saprospiraceae bacterium]